MVKRLTNPSNKKNIKELEKAICRKKNLSANLEEFVKKLTRKHQNISTKQYLIRIHNYIHNYKTVIKKTEDATKPAFKFGRVCKQCGDWKDRQKMVECLDCQDYYHIECLEDQNIDRKHWKCSLCMDIQENITRENTLQRHYGKAQQSKKPKKKCNQCKDLLNNKTASCMKCGFQYHFKCFGKQDSNVIVCGNCHKQIQDQISNRRSMKQKTLYDYFSAKDTDEWTKMEKSQVSTIHDELTISFCSALNLKAPLKLQEKEIAQYKKQLLYAIYSKKMEYSEELVFESEIPWDIYYQDLSMEYINKKDEQAYIAYKKQPIGPYKMEMIQGMGYDVKADKNIPKGTIICEYIGEVITKRQAQHELHNDSLMDLMMGINADSSLVIKPEKYTNMARFINGVNQNDPVLSKKANVKSIKLGICGRPTILLYASKKINKGESLLYNYNGGLQFYRTSDFV